jgi:NAD(P)H-dependent flavin oxidoreductase YrpB (nitropropane dioxygenase family)
MFAAKEFSMLAKISMEEGIDIIFFGAGFSRDIFEQGRETNYADSSLSALRSWLFCHKNLEPVPSFLKAVDAGGHLGTDKSLDELLPEVRKAMDEASGGKSVPLIAAGGIADGFDIAKFLKMGADGVQLGTRFLLSSECEASEKFKQLLVNAKESDIVKILSPVGLSARAVISNFTKKILENNPPKPQYCDQCLKKCSRNFCIMRALNLSCNGDLENGLFFTGKSLLNIHDILPVKEIFKKLETEIKASI